MRHPFQLFMAAVAIALAMVPLSVLAEPTAPESSRASQSILILPENSLTNGGLNIAPTHHLGAGDIDMNVMGGFINYPQSLASLAGGQFSIEAGLTDNLQALADFGNDTTVGFRGPLVTFRDWQIGWDAHYRSDLYFLVKSGMGLSAPMFGLGSFPGSSAQGMELAVNTMVPWRNFNFYLTPTVSLMSNRSLAGIDGGMDWNIGRLGLGYSVSYRRNVLNPDQSNSAVMAAELQQSIGARYRMTDKVFAQITAYTKPGDTYGIPVQGVLVGIGMRLSLEAPKSIPVAPVAAVLQEPQPQPALQLVTAPPLEISSPSVAATVPASATSVPEKIVPPATPLLAENKEEVIAAPKVDPPSRQERRPHPQVQPPVQAELQAQTTPVAAAKPIKTSDSAALPVTAVGPFAVDSATQGPFASAEGKVMSGPFPAESVLSSVENLARNEEMNSEGAPLSLKSALGKLSPDQDADNGAAATVAIVVCCLMLLSTGSKSD